MTVSDSKCRCRLTTSHVSSVPTLAVMTNKQRRRIIVLIPIGNASHLVPSSQPSDAASSIIDWLMAMVLSPLIAQSHRSE